MRYAPLDIEKLLDRVLKDIIENEHESIKVGINIDFTHADVGRVPFVFNHEDGFKIDTIKADTIPNRIIRSRNGLVSYGPTANHVKKVLDNPQNRDTLKGERGGSHETVENGTTPA